MSSFIKRVVVFPNFYTGHEVYWEIDPLAQLKSPVFALQAAEDLDFAIVLFTKNVGSNLFAVDDYNLKNSISMDYYYRVVIKQSDGTITYSSPIRFGTKPAQKRVYQMAYEIIRKEKLSNAHAGFTGYLYSRMSYGPTAAAVDPVSGVPLADNTQDLGTGIVGGYANPVPISFTIITKTEDKQLSPDGNGMKETYDMMIRAPGYPLFNNRDVLALPYNGDRYICVSHEYNHFPSTLIPVVQKVSLRRAAPGDTVFSLPLPSNK